ncbi:MAG: hypothetical protein FWC96_05185 [Oscillospiraceae bacterium]|nr:hypothetical protein [Oscillospiraceae bacterium]
MKRRIIFCLICAAVVVMSGCAAIIEGEIFDITPRPIPPYERPPELDYLNAAANYYELHAAVLYLITHHSESGRIVIHGYEGEIEEDFEKVRHDILNYDPLGTFAVYDISGAETRIGTYLGFDIDIEYRISQRQVESILPIYSVQELTDALLRYMGEYRDEIIFRTSLPDVTANMVTALVRTLYYENPRGIVIMPVTSAEVFPETHGDDKIIELQLRFGDESGILHQRGGSLADAVRRNAELAVGGNDEEKLRALAENLIASCDFDYGAAMTVAEHGSQRTEATAYGALVAGRAVGEGFAMAFKALADELGIDTRVVLGYLNDMVHAWNKVYLDGEAYHIDAAMGAVNGIETVFMRTGADFIEMGYSW